MIRKFAAFVPVLALAGTTVFAAQAPATDNTTKTEKTTKKHSKKHGKKAKTPAATPETKK